MAKGQDIEAVLRKALQECGRPVVAVAREAKVPQGCLSLFVNRKRSLTLPTAAKVARALGMELRPVKKGARSNG